MGTIRLLLALAVVFSHASAYQIMPAWTPVYGFWPVEATIAIEMFFVISGFLMSFVLSEKYRALDGFVWKFYLNRYSRLLPSYLIVVVATVWFSSSPLWYAPTQSLAMAAYKFSATTLFGIDITQFYSIGDGQLAQSQLPVPQAWSMGIEICFYILAPWLTSLRTRRLVMISAVLLAARVAAAFCLDVYPWQQRLFPLEMYFFVAGILSHRFYESAFRQVKNSAVFVLMVALACFAGYGTEMRGWTPINAIFYGAVLAACLPAIFALTRDNKVDRWIGEFSYPVYLVHMLVMGIVPHARDSMFNAVLFSFAASVPLVALIEVPLEQWRQRFFRRQNGTSSYRKPPASSPMAIDVTSTSGPVSTAANVT